MRATQFASQGLRTLCFAGTLLDPAQYEQWAQIYERARTSLVNREKEVRCAVLCCISSWWQFYCVSVLYYAVFVIIVSVLCHLLTVCPALMCIVFFAVRLG